MVKWYVFFFFQSIILLFAVDSYSQQTRLTLKFKDAILEDVLNEIEKKSEFYFLYNNDLIDTRSTVNMEVNKAKIEVVLDKLFNGTDINYIISDHQIVLTNSDNQFRLKNDSVQQRKSILGRVTDKTGASFPGVTVVLDGTTIGTITDANGNYSIGNILGNGTLRFSFVGMKSQEVKVLGRTSFNVVLTEELIRIEEVVVVGYGTQNLLEVTSAIASVKTYNFIKGSVKDAAQLLQGKVAGLTIVTPSGDPNAPSQILLRGIATLASSTQPLILVDGIPGILNTVPPEEIESIDVLKDGSSAAIYGTRGTNGVILISTKRASGNLKYYIDYNSYISTQSFVNLPKMLSAEQYRAKLAKGTSFTDLGSTTDWVKEISRNNPFSHNHNLTLTGGNAQTNYLAALSYRQLEGVFITSESRTFNNSFDLNHNMFNDKLKINLNYLNTNTKSGVSWDDTVFGQAMRYNPTAPIKNPDGTWYENGLLTGNHNPVAWLKEEYGDTQTKSVRVSGSLTWLPFKNLNFKMLVSNSVENWMSSIGRTKNHYVSTQQGKNGEAYKSFGQSTDQLMELTAFYNRTLNFHKFSALAGYSYQHNINENGGMYNYNFPAGNYSYIDNIGLGNAINGRVGVYSYKVASNLIGFFGRLNYNYKEKYLLMGSLRYEASSRFVGTKQPWGTFPAISVGWRISEEDFIKKISFVNNLKLRIGYGVTGTAPDELFLGVRQLGYTAERFLVDGEWVRGLGPINNPNPYLKWEVKKEANIGMDFGVLKGKLTGNIDFYDRHTDELLYDYQVPSPPNLFDITKANVGVMDNRGIEILLNYTPLQTKEFTWNSSITFSTNRNRLVSLENDLYKTTNPWFDAGMTPTPIGIVTHRIEVGKRIGNFWGYKVIDITEGGNWIYEDKDGNPAATVNESDKRVIGNGLPKFYAGWNNSFRFGNFDLDVTMRGAFGFQIVNIQRMFMEVPGFSGYNQLSSAYDKVFGKVALNKSVYPDYNSYYIENGDYWKIDNVTFGYNFDISEKKYIKSARLYVSTLNTLIITGYKGMDPEVNQLGLDPGIDDKDKCPTTRVYTIGLKISFQ